MSQLAQPARAVADWPTPSGPLDVAAENVEAAANLKVAWRRRFGDLHGPSRA